MQICAPTKVRFGDGPSRAGFRLEGQKAGDGMAAYSNQKSFFVFFRPVSIYICISKCLGDGARLLMSRCIR